MVEYVKEPFILKLHLKKRKKEKERVNVIHIKKKKKKNRTQRKSIINKREENKEEFAKDGTLKFVGTSDSKCL